VSVTVNLNRELKTTGVACATWAASVPVPLTLKLYGSARLLCAVTVKGAPATVGITEAGETVHVGGATPPQLRFTALAYPFSAFSVPLNVPDVFTVADTGELLMVSV
jgi:hypothetical protein